MGRHGYLWAGVGGGTEWWAHEQVSECVLLVVITYSDTGDRGRALSGRLRGFEICT